MSLLLILLLLIPASIYLFLNHARKRPHGVVELKTALVLSFLKEYKGNDILKVRKDFKKMIRTDYSTKLPISTVKNFNIPIASGDIPVRYYSPESETSLPLIIFIHGGGWCIGDLDTHDQQCRRLVKSSGYALISIDYSLSPEVKFPVALHEIVGVIQAIRSGEVNINIDRNQMTIIGDSAGGNMTISSTLKLIEAGSADYIKCIVPVYPVTNCEEGKTGSFETLSEGYILTSHMMNLFSKNYLDPDQDLRDPYLSPIFSESLNKLPPCFVLTAGLDPLKDEGEAFADILKSKGNNVKLKRYENCVHSFFGQQEFGTKGLEAIEDVTQFLKIHIK